MHEHCHNHKSKKLHSTMLTAANLKPKRSKIRMVGQKGQIIKGFQDSSVVSVSTLAFGARGPWFKSR